MVKIGIIGLGHAGRRHQRALKQLGILNDIVDPKNPFCRPTIGELVAAFEPDGVIIASPPALHWEHADQVLREAKGTLKGLYIEKPLCPTYAEAQDLAERCRQQRVHLRCGYQLRYHPSLIAYGDRIAQAEKPVEYGSILSDDMAAWPKNTYERDLLLEYSHELDLADYLMGGIATVSATRQGAIGYSISFSASYGYGLIKLLHGAKQRRVMSFCCGDADPIEWEFSSEENELAYEDAIREWRLRGERGTTGERAALLIEAVRRSCENHGRSVQL